jgi:hypothetical protein
LCFRVPVGTGVPPWGPPHHPGPAVHRYGTTALLWAANCGNRRIVRLLVAFKADVNTPDCNGCAVSAAANRRSAAAEPPPPSAVQVHAAALGRAQWHNRRHRRAAAARRRRGRPEPPRRVTLRCAAQPTETAQPRAFRSTPKQWAEDRGELARYEAAEREVHSARRLTALPTPLPRAPSLSVLLVPTDVPSVLSVGARRASGQGGNIPRSTRTGTDAPRRTPRRALLHPRVEV